MIPGLGSIFGGSGSTIPSAANARQDLDFGSTGAGIVFGGSESNDAGNMIAIGAGLIALTALIVAVRKK